VTDAAAPVPSRRADVVAVVTLTLLATLWFGDVLIGINNVYMRDLTRYYYPTKQVLREIVLGGEFPYWNRYFSAGQPIAANPEHEVFYPLTWLILLPSYDFGYRLLLLIHIYIGLLGMYALLRSMELRPSAAWFGAMAFGLGGLYLSYVNLLPILFCAAWLPLTCLFVRRFLLHPNKRDFALSALFLGLQFLVAEPTTVMQTGLLLGLYALYRGWYSQPRLSSMLTRVGWIALISLGGLLIGAAQILPALDHVGDSSRSRPFEFDLVSAWSMPWSKFGELIFPNILGHISIGREMVYWGGGLYTGMGSPFIFSIYVGLAVAALVVGGAFVRPRGGRFVLLVCLLSSIMALGGHTPLLKWLYNAHIATSIRYPEKFVLMGIFALILFASQMLDRMLAGDDAVRDGAIGFALAATTVATMIAVLALTTNLHARAFMKVWVVAAGPLAKKEVGLSQLDWIVASLRGMILLALLFTVRMLPRRVWLAAAALYVAADLAYVTAELNPRMPRRFFDPPPIASTFPPNRADFRIFHDADWYGTEKPAVFYFSTGDAVYWVVRNGLFPMTPAGARLRTVLERDYDKTALLPTVDLTDCIWDVKRSGRPDWYRPFMAMSNAWYRAVYRNFDEEKKRNHGDFKNSIPIRFEETAHYPRYYFANQVVPIKDRQDFVKKLSSSVYSDATAFVQQPGFVPGSGTVRRVTETANRADLDVETSGRGFLVMSVTPHKYWRITVDGAAVRPVVTNIAYQGIVVPAGRHRVTMVYVNDLVRRGLTISLITIALLLILALLPNRPAEPAVEPALEPATTPAVA
jgi:hypothetical protein